MLTSLCITSEAGRFSSSPSNLGSLIICNNWPVLIPSVRDLLPQSLCLVLPHIGDCGPYMMQYLSRCWKAQEWILQLSRTHFKTFGFQNNMNGNFHKCEVSRFHNYRVSEYLLVALPLPPFHMNAWHLTHLVTHNCGPYHLRSTLRDDLGYLTFCLFPRFHTPLIIVVILYYRFIYVT